MLKKGTTAINGVFKGTAEIAKIFKGINLVYKKRLLPYGYRQLEYIESTGTQYIDTGVKNVNSTKFTYEYKMRQTAEGAKLPAGARSSTNARLMWGIIGTTVGGNYQAGYGSTYTNVKINEELLNKWNVIKSEIINNKYRISLIGNSTYYIDFNLENFDTSQSIYLFGCNDQGSLFTTYPYTGDIQYVKMYNDGVLIRHFVPCKNLSNEVGMYDLVNGVFYANQGTGAFIAGPEIALPDGYTELKYIEATGEQYLDTGVVPNANTQVDYKIRFRQDATTASPLIGARVGNSGINRFFPISYSNPSTDYRVSFGNALISGTIDFNIDYEGSFQPQNEVLILNGTSYSLAGHSFTKSTNYNLYLFATSGYSGNLYQSKGVIYYCKIYKNNELVRNYIPCKNDNNEIGMYDLINGTFYSNQGTGSFIAGQ